MNKHLLKLTLAVLLYTLVRPPVMHILLSSFPSCLTDCSYFHSSPKISSAFSPSSSRFLPPFLPISFPCFLSVRGKIWSKDTAFSNLDKIYYVSCKDPHNYSRIRLLGFRKRRNRRAGDMKAACKRSALNKSAGSPNHYHTT